MELASFHLRHDQRYVQERLDHVVQSIYLDLQRTTIVDANKPVARIKLLFRWLLINFGVKLQDMKAADINRVTRAVNIIDTREVFYGARDDEVPEWAVDSVQKARDELRLISGDVWADHETGHIVNRIHESLADFRTAVSRLKPMPRNHHSPNWDQFERELIDLRLRIWCLVAALKRLHGSVVSPLHLPHEIEDLISKARFSQKSF
jgi:hypothetical protein